MHAQKFPCLFWACGWVSIFNRTDPDLKANRSLQIGLAIVIVPLSMVAIMAFYAAAMPLSQFLALIAVLLGFPRSYEEIDGVLSSQLAGPVSGWAAALFPWVAIAYSRFKGAAGTD